MIMATNLLCMKLKYSNVDMDVHFTWLRDEVLGWRNPGFVTYLVITILVALTIVWFFKRQHKVWLLNQIPGPRGLPLLGNILYISVDPLELLQRLLKICDHGEVARIWIGTRPLVLLSSAKAVEVVLRSQKLLEKSSDYAFFNPWLGQSLLTSTGNHWQKRRKLLTPAFHFKILDEFLDVMNKHSRQFTHKLQKKADGTPFDIFTDIALCVLDTVCETTMGRSVNAQENSELDYVKAVYRMSSIIQYRSMRPWLYSDFMFNLLGWGKEQDAHIQIFHGMSRSIIKARRELARQNKTNKNVIHQEEQTHGGKKQRLAFLDLLLQYSEHDSDFTDEEIRKEVDTLMFAGHDTTSATINWFLYNMGAHPHIQARVQEELDGIFSGTDRPVTMEDIKIMKYTELCIKETLRLYPAVPLISRKIEEEVTVCNYRIPAPTTITLFIYKLHQDPEQFPNPKRFDPDRFLPENAAKRHPYAYVPFSAGPRNCIGQKFAMIEMKVLLSSILRKFNVESVQSPGELKLLAELILRPQDGNILKVLPRK